MKIKVESENWQMRMMHLEIKTLHPSAVKVGGWLATE